MTARSRYFSAKTLKIHGPKFPSFDIRKNYPFAYLRRARAFCSTPALDNTGVVYVSGCDVVLGVVIFLHVSSALLQEMLSDLKRFSYEDCSMLGLQVDDMTVQVHHCFFSLGLQSLCFASSKTRSEQGCSVHHESIDTVKKAIR